MSIVNKAGSLVSEQGVFGPGELDDMELFFRQHGFVIFRGLLSSGDVDALEAQCVHAQDQLIAAQLPDRHGTSILIEAEAGAKAERFANYVTYITDLAPATRTFVQNPSVIDLMGRWLGRDAWLLDDARFGVVYQDARPGRESSYTRIGWHSDWQSAPNLDIFPSVAFTIHIDATSPANGFLRVVPDSHLWATPAPYDNVNGAPVPDGSRPWGGYTDVPPPYPMPLRFEYVPGEIPVYAERGDVLFHDAYLWHSAARATDDETRRRHIRGGWYSGTHLDSEHLEDFVKNAAR